MVQLPLRVVARQDFADALCPQWRLSVLPRLAVAPVEDFYPIVLLLQLTVDANVDLNILMAAVGGKGYSNGAHSNRFNRERNRLATEYTVQLIRKEEVFYKVFALGFTCSVSYASDSMRVR